MQSLHDNFHQLRRNVAEQHHAKEAAIALGGNRKSTLKKDKFFIPLLKIPEYIKK